MPPNSSYRDQVLLDTIDRIDKLSKSARSSSNDINRSLGQNLLKSASETIRDYHNPNIPDESFKILCDASLDYLSLRSKSVRERPVNYTQFSNMLDKITGSVNSQVIQLEDPK